MNNVNKINPKNIFLLDGLGALLTAFLLSTVFTKFETIFGMPEHILSYLSMIAFAYASYSLLNYFLKAKSWIIYLKIIAIANLMYCILTITMVINFYQKLTALGLFYFVFEIIIIFSLAIIEYKIISKHIKNTIQK